MQPHLRDGGLGVQLGGDAGDRLHVAQQGLGLVRRPRVARVAAARHEVHVLRVVAEHGHGVVQLPAHVHHARRAAELQVARAEAAAQLLAAEVRDAAVLDAEELDHVAAEVGHQEHAAGEGAEVDLVQVRPALPVRQVLPPVRAVRVHVGGARVAVDLRGLAQRARLAAHGEGGDLAVPVADGDEVRARHVPGDVTRGPAVHALPVRDGHTALAPEARGPVSVREDYLERSPVMDLKVRIVQYTPTNACLYFG